MPNGGDHAQHASAEDTANWTREAIDLEKQRRETEDLSALGPRPSWWRLRARQRYDHEVTRLKKAHAEDLCTMLATQDMRRRAIVAKLIGWKPPTKGEDDR